MKHVGVTADPKDIATQEQLGSMTPSLDLDDVSGLVPALAAKEPAIAAGTASQFWRGDKTWQDFAGAVRSAVLTGLSTATSTVVAAADSVLVAIGKLQAQLGLKANLSGAAFTGTISTTGNVSVANSVYVGGSGNGRLFGKNGAGVTVMEAGVASFSGYGDSVGFGSVITNGQLDLATNSISRVTIMGNGDTNVNSGRLLLLGHPTTASAANCHIDAGGLIYRSTSSARYKKDVEDLDESIAESVYGMRPVWFRSTNKDDPADWSWLGLIAEEVAQVEPRLAQWAYLPDAWNPAEDVVTYDEDGNELRSPGKATLKEGAQKVPDGVQYDRFVVPLIACVQQQRKDIEALQARITALESKQ